jgi:WD40 repeat protein
MSVVARAPVSPFKGLAAFEDSELDALLFFGRERETEIIVSNLLASKLTVLYGPSGVGKSSVLRAAVVRRLRELAPDAEVALVAEWAAEPSLPWPDDEAFLLLDQFEEYFLYHDEEPLLGQLLPLLARPHVHVLIALREDTLARLDAFQARLPDVFANRLRLDHLDAVAARAAIVGPLETWNAIVPADDRMGVEPALVEAVLDEVAAPEAIGAAPATGRIEAPYLQLIMERVWEEERAAGSPLLRAETLRRLGGARAIVSTHLERALAALPPRDAAIATGALRFLVTPSRTKIAHSFGDLVEYTNESPVELQAVLDRLASQRILRSSAVGGDGGRRYEIFHDVPAEPVLAWRREFETRTAVDRERATAARRPRRLLAIAGGAAVLASVMIVLAAYAFMQRNEASKQKRAAEVKTALAVKLQRDAVQQKLRADLQKQSAVAQRKKAIAAKHLAVVNLARAQASERRLKASEARAKASATAAKRNAAAAQKSKVTALRATHAAKIDLRRAKRETLLRHVGELVARAAAELVTDPVLSLESALAASALQASNQVEDALRNALIAMHVRGILNAGGGAVNASAFSPDGALVATGADGGQLRVFRTQTHTLVYKLKTGVPVLTLAFSRPDGRTLAAGTHDGRVLLDDVASGGLRTLHAGGAVLDIRFAGGGRFVVAGGADKTLRIWDAATGVPVDTITFKRAVISVPINPDGSLVAAVLAGGSVVNVYDVASGMPVGSVEQPGEVTGAAFSPNGAYLVTTGARNGYVWDAHTWAQLHVLSGHTQTITDVVFGANGNVVTASADTSARIWDPATGALLHTLQGAHQQRLLAVAVSPDGVVATASADETARIWTDADSTPRLLAGHTDAVTGESYSRDGSLLLTASADGTARLWGTRVPTLRRLGLQQGAISTVASSPDGKLVLSAGADGTARLWRTDGKGALTLNQGGPVTDAAFTAAGVLTAGTDGSAKLWRVSDGALLATYPHGAPVRAAVAVDGGVVTAGDDGVLRAWTSGGRLRWVETHGSPITAAAASIDGTVATGAADGTVRLWRGRDGKPLFTLRGHTGAVSSLSFDATGALLVSGSKDSTARIWDVRTGRNVQTLVGHKLAVTSASFSPDGKLVLTSSGDGDARLWSVKTGHSVEHLKFHVAAVTQAAFSLDGRWAVTAGPTAAAIWQVRTGRLILYMKGARGVLTSAGWAPDSLRIVTGDAGGGVETFTCEVCGRTAALRALARTRLGALH